MSWHQTRNCYGEPRPKAYLHQLRGETESQCENADAPFTRLANAFTRKIENHMYALALFHVHHNFAPCPSDAPRYSSDGSEDQSACVVNSENNLDNHSNQVMQYSVL